MHGHAHCVQFLRKYNIPLILLGGGGYTVKNVARTWTYETACALGIEGEIDPNLPWNQYFEWFGPRYRLEVVNNNMDDLNVKEGSLDVVRLVLLVLLAIKHLTLLYTGLQRWNSCNNWLVRRLRRCKMYRMRPSANTLVLAETKKKEEMNWTNVLLVSIFCQTQMHTDFKKYTEHARYVYNLQDTDTTTEDSEGSDSWDSDESSSSHNNWRRGPYRSSSASRINGRYTQLQPQYTSTAERKRMSLITGKYYDIPIHENGFSHFDGSTSIGKQPTKRRFFPDAPGKWDDVGVCVVDASVKARIVGGNMIDEGFGNGYGYAMVPELARIMERGGGLDGYGDGEPDEGEEEEEDVSMST